MKHSARAVIPIPDCDDSARFDPNSRGLSDVDSFVTEILADLRNNRLVLPTLPNLAININRAVSSDNFNAKKIARLISSDPAVSVNIIRAVNSPMLRGNTKIDSVQMAVTRMGSNTVRNIVTAVLVKQLFSSKNKILKKMLSKIWTHSTHVAALSHILATKCSSISPDEAMVAGLLHDIGKLPIIAKATKIPNLDKNIHILNSVLDKLHPTLGAAILKSWDFPQYIATAVAEHENMKRDSEALDHTDIVMVADIHSHLTTPGYVPIDLNTIPALKKLSLDSDTSIQILKDAHEEMLEIQKMLLAS
ncbi:MAG: HDOD domain-containing protein [Thiohalomonadales bacterium]